MTLFTEAERAFLKTQLLGRLATVKPGGQPQNNPVGYHVNDELGTIDIGGYNLAATAKFRNVRAHPEVAFVIDALVSLQPWTVKGIEIRGRAEALTDIEPFMKGMSRELIRIRPERILVWGIDPDGRGMQARTVS